MSLLGRIRNRVRAVAARARLEHDMQEEMREHIAQAADRFRARGMAEADALAAARLEFGNVGVLQEEARDARGARWIESVSGDLRYAVRQIRRAPLLATTIILTLTLAIGVGAAAIGTIAGVFSRPAPGVPADDALIAIRGLQTYDGNRVDRYVSYPELMEYARLGQFAEVAGAASSEVVVAVAGQAAGSAVMYFVTPNYFHTLGLRIGAGAGFAQTRVDDHSTPELTAVIARLYAIARFGSEAEALGKTIRVNGVNVQIAGIAPPRFIGATSDGSRNALWMPVSAWPVIDRQVANPFSDQGRTEFRIIGRLRKGVSQRDATPAVELVAARAASMARAIDRESHGKAWTADVVPLRGDLRVKSSRADSIAAVGMILAVVVLILLVCTTTVSSLLVGASVTRRHEIAVRLALGASRRRIVRQLLTESVLLAGVACVLGLVAFALISRGLHDSITDVNFDPSWMTALLTAALAMGAAMLCGLSPALHATRDGVAGVLKDSATNATAKSRLQRVFVVAQIALTQPLLMGLAVAVAIVMREGGHTLSSSVTERVVRARFDNWSAAARAENRLPAVMQRIRSLPGVLAVLPQVSGYRQMKIEVPTTGARVSARTEHIAAGYFKAMDIRLVRGREFVDADTLLQVSPIVIGSDFATQAFGDIDPVGKRIAIFGNAGERFGEAEVVGVVAVADVGESEYGQGIRVFAPNGGPLSGMPPNGMLIRTASLAKPLIPTFREIANAEAPLTPIIDIGTLAEAEAYTRSEIVQAASASAIGGIIALFLAAIGLYAVVALGVGQRRREIGVRLSLGARPGQVVAMFFRGGLRVSLLGLAIGLPLSAVAMAVVGSQAGMPRTNLPAIAALVASVVVVVASLATWIPARRAAGVDPLIALRDA